jgi:predicted dehydrogenase
MSAPVRIAVAGAGLIGSRHAAALALAQGARLHAVADPSPEARELAERQGWSFHSSLEALLASKPDGVILATPNALHVEGALACIEAGIPVLVEKPLATDSAGARAIVEAGAAAGVPVLTGHHRRHMPVVAEARRQIAEGRLGKLVAVHGMFWIAKPDSYFETPWRRQKGAGPLQMNLIHDLDLVRWLAGDIARVQAVAGNRVRGHEIEDAAAILITFASGALGSFSVSDAIVAPWSWELTAGDNPAYPPTPENAYWFGGTLGSLALPRGEVWSDGGRRDWWQPIARETLLRAAADPLVAQVENFAAVIRGTDEPVCSGEDGLAAVRALDAVRRAVGSGRGEVP